MPLYFSADPIGFWDSALHSDIPNGAVEISASLYNELLAGQSSGKVIAADGKGQPILADRPGQAPAVPVVVSRFQARVALRNAGHFEAAEAAIYASGDVLLIEAWESAVEFRRMSPSIVALGAALGLDDASIDQLFRDAAVIRA